MDINEFNDIRNKNITKAISRAQDDLVSTKQWLKELSELSLETTLPTTMTQTQYNCPTLHYALCHYCMAPCDYDRTDTNYHDQDNNELCASCFVFFGEEHNVAIAYKDVSCSKCHENTVEKAYWTKSYYDIGGCLDKRMVLTKPLCGDCIKELNKPWKEQEHGPMTEEDKAFIKEAFPDYNEKL